MANAIEDELVDAEATNSESSLDNLGPALLDIVPPFVSEINRWYSILYRRFSVGSCDIGDANQRTINNLLLIQSMLEAVVAVGAIGCDPDCATQVSAYYHLALVVRCHVSVPYANSRVNRSHEQQATATYLFTQ
jgi:hypothetical protein